MVSILSVTNEAGTIVAEQNFDAWGRYRNPANWTYTAIPARPHWLNRGFTGHEHLTQFALINMNGRMYDPMTGLMMSPDNYVPMPLSPGGYNRYNYAYGNPLKFVDPSGWNIEEDLNGIIEDLWGKPNGGTWNRGGGGPTYFQSNDQAFGFAVSQISQYGWWGSGSGGSGGTGQAGSPQAALNNYNHATGTSGVTDGMWQGYMESKWSGYAQGISTVTVNSARLGTSFLTSGLTFADANLGAYASQIISYSKAEQMFLGYQQNGGSGWSKANIVMGGVMTGLGFEGELMDYAVRTSFKSARTWSEFNKLRPTQQAWRQMAILGKEAQILRTGINVLSKTTFALQAGVSIYNAGSAMYNRDANMLGVAGKAALDLTVGAISVWGGPVGWAVGGLYFIGDAAGWWGDWGKPAGHP